MAMGEGWRHCCRALFALLIALAIGAEEKKVDYMPSAQKVKVTVEQPLRDGGNADNDAVVKRLEDAKTWEGYFKRIDESLGIYRKDGLPIAVALKAQNTYPRRGMGSVGRNKSGSLWISVPALVQSAKAKKLDLAATVDNIVTHELIHSLQQDAAGNDLTRQWPTWLTEGMADFAAYDEPNAAEMRALAPLTEKDIDASTGTPAYMRLRGWVFLKFLQETYGKEKTKECLKLLMNGEAYKKAVETATGASWETLKGAEQKWSKEYATKK
ncbi:MAG: hypothetical protein A2Z34_01975 [Planctomycetes bacterium RBG_16_59_8]|nr:MAG: hypothetical protein A2Z34_01975 [Planctomycetes bacterium RBG_16_59_8]